MLGQPDVVTVTADAAEAFTGADYVFSAIRVGGDRGRVIDEQVALRRGIVGQETTGPGGCAMALRTIPVVLSYCELLSQCAPEAVLINFTNPAGLITQAISAQGKVRAVGVCDTPSGTIADLARFAGVAGEGAGQARAGYGGLNHLGWVTSFEVGGEDLLPGLIARFEDLQRSGSPVRRLRRRRGTAGRRDPDRVRVLLLRRAALRRRRAAGRIKPRPGRGRPELRAADRDRAGLRRR